MPIKNLRTAFLFAVGLGLPGVAQAQDIQQRRSPLADAPAVRRRAELRSGRFELGVGVGATVGQDFYHAVLVGPKLALHVTDWLALGVTAQFNVTKDFKTSFTDQLSGTLDDQPAMDRSPSLTRSLQSMNKIGQVLGAHAELIPFSGKLSLFSSIFASYDFYAFGGVGAINFVADGDPCTTPGEYCPVTGFKIGPNFGLGMRTFVNDWFAVNIEARDVLLNNNPAGRDVNGDRVVDDNDLELDSNYMVSLNFVFLLPSKAKISD